MDPWLLSGTLPATLPCRKTSGLQADSLQGRTTKRPVTTKTSVAEGIAKDTVVVLQGSWNFAGEIKVARSVEGENKRAAEMWTKVARLM